MQAEPLSETVKNILAQFPGPVVLRQEEYNQYHPLAVALLVILLGQPALWIEEWSWPPTRYLLVGVTSTIVGLYIVIRVARAVATGGMWMKLDAYGIEYRFWMKHEPRRWSWAAKDFDVKYLGFKSSVVTFEDSAKANWWELNRILSYGGRQRLPNVTDLNDKDLAQLVNLWRARALTPAPANT
jgi:hypothetical protein